MTGRLITARAFDACQLCLKAARRFCCKDQLKASGAMSCSASMWPPRTGSDQEVLINALQNTLISPCNYIKRTSYSHLDPPALSKSSA